MLTSSASRSFQALLKGTLEGTINPKRLGWFCVYGSGNLPRCMELLGRFQIAAGSSDRGLRLLDAQLEIQRLLDEPEMIDTSLRAQTPELFNHKTVLAK